MSFKGTYPFEYFLVESHDKLPRIDSYSQLGDGVSDIHFHGVGVGVALDWWLVQHREWDDDPVLVVVNLKINQSINQK